MHHCHTPRLWGACHFFHIGDLEWWRKCKKQKDRRCIYFTVTDIWMVRLGWTYIFHNTEGKLFILIVIMSTSLLLQCVAAIRVHHMAFFFFSKAQGGCLDRNIKMLITWNVKQCNIYIYSSHKSIKSKSPYFSTFFLQFMFCWNLYKQDNLPPNLTSLKTLKKTAVFTQTWREITETMFSCRFLKIEAQKHQLQSVRNESKRVTRTVWRSLTELLHVSLESATPDVLKES